MKRSRSVRAYVVRLVIAVTVPLLAFGGFLLIRSAHNEQQAIALTADERAEGAAADLDRELRHLQDLAFMTAASPHLFAGDAVLPYPSTPPPFKIKNLGIVVRDLSGLPILNTCVPSAPSFPVGKYFESITHDLHHDRVFISDITTEPITGEPLLTMDLPMWQEDGSAYILGLCVLPRILQVLTGQHLPEDWTAIVVDRQGRTIAAIGESASGSVAAAGNDAAAVISAEAKSFIADLWGNLPSAYEAASPVNLAGWTVAVRVPGSVFVGPVRRSLLILFTAGAGALALVFVLAVNIGRRIANPITDLTGIAKALGGGSQVAPLSTGVNEADLVAHALCSTSKDLSLRTAELTQTISALRHGERRLQQLSDDLRRALEQRTELLTRVISSQESERQRIARELHDHLGQYFAAMLIGLDAAEKEWSRGDEGRQRLAELKAITSTVSREVHQLSWELRPTALDDLGLEAAMANYPEKWRERFNSNVDFIANLQGTRVSAPVEITLYRVLQEAMANIAKHANAKRVSVVLEANASEVRLCVEDNGSGFDQDDSCGSVRRQDGFGLLGIRERLALVGGSLIIETAPNCGAALFCRIPA
jgi:signal transduction histidine kinase